MSDKEKDEVLGASGEALHKELRELEDNELVIQSRNRQEMLRDHQYYDGQQWDPADAAILLARGQAPVSYNLLKPRIDWLTGTERRARIDFKVLPRGKDPRMADDARLKTDVLKYLSDVNSAPFQYSEVFKQAAIAGKSWIENGIDGDPDRELLRIRKEDWWNILEDSCSSDMDGRDMRYLFRRRFLDLDVANAYFPKARESNREAAYGTNANRRQDEYYLGIPLSEWDVGATSMATSRYSSFDVSPWMRSTRQRVMYRECYHYKPTREANGVVKMRLRLSIFNDKELVFDDFSPFRHNAIPFVPVYCYRRAIDNAPYGIVRQLRDPQDSYNKRMSKSLFAISSSRVELEADAIDPNKMTVARMREEIAKPNAVLQFAQGAIAGGKVKISDGRDVAAAHLGFAQQDQAFIAQTAGVNNENLGLQTNASSGKAIGMRQNEGTVSTTEPFDNLHLARRAAGIQQLALLEQFYQAPRAFRITGDAQANEWREINTFNEETGQYENDITEFSADFVLDQQQYQATLAQAAMQELMALLQQMATVDPMFVRAVIDLFIEYSQIPGKDVILKRIREITGYRDPSTPETPEEAQARMAKEQMAQQTQQMEVDLAMAKLQELKSKNKLTDAKAVGEFMTAFFSAMQAASVNAQSATLAPVADSMLESAGFKVLPGDDPNIPIGSGQAVEVAGDPQSAGTGINQGIETMAPDTVTPGV